MFPPVRSAAAPHAHRRPPFACAARPRSPRKRRHEASRRDDEPASSPRSPQRPGTSTCGGRRTCRPSAGQPPSTCRAAKSTPLPLPRQRAAVACLGSDIEPVCKSIRRRRRCRQTCEKDKSGKAKSQMTGHGNPGVAPPHLRPLAATWVTMRLKSGNLVDSFWPGKRDLDPNRLSSMRSFRACRKRFLEGNVSCVIPQSVTRIVSWIL